MSLYSRAAADVRRALPSRQVSASPTCLLLEELAKHSLVGEPPCQGSYRAVLSVQELSALRSVSQVGKQAKTMGLAPGSLSQRACALGPLTVRAPECPVHPGTPSLVSAAAMGEGLAGQCVQHASEPGSQTSRWPHGGKRPQTGSLCEPV